jgi:hypothetical protein
LRDEIVAQPLLRAMRECAALTGSSSTSELHD